MDGMESCGFLESSKGSENWFEKSDSSRNSSALIDGNDFWFELAEGVKNRGFKDKATFDIFRIILKWPRGFRLKIVVLLVSFVPQVLRSHVRIVL